MVTVVNSAPHPSVVKEVICRKCGATLSYVPQDVMIDMTTDYPGSHNEWPYIKCPLCSNKISVERPVTS
jgi:DNA-directed RNA polymerase subunit RPC12/RpoP